MSPPSKTLKAVQLNILTNYSAIYVPSGGTWDAGCGMRDTGCGNLIANIDKWRPKIMTFAVFPSDFYAE
jgi:hypothetical protein